MDKNPPANARDTDLIPGLGRFYLPPPCVLLLPTAMCLEPVLQTREAIARRSLCITTKSSLRSPQLKKTLVQQQRPRATGKKIKAKERKKKIKPAPVLETV